MTLHRLALWIAGGLLCAAIAGCATYDKPLSPALFPPAAAAATRDPARVVLVLADRDQHYRSPRQSGYLFEIGLPIGRIVEAAGLRALAAEFEHVAGADAPADPRALQLRVDDVSASVHSRFVYFIPLGPIPLNRVDLKTRVAFTIRLLAPDGSTRWSQRGDSGEELLVPRRQGLFVVEAPSDGAQRAVHEQAARLMQAAARDLRTWLEQEQRRERVL